MITYLLLKTITAPIRGLFEPLRTITLPSASIDKIAPYIKLACQFLPMDTISVIVKFLIVLLGIRLAIAVLKTIWQITPFT